MNGNVKKVEFLQKYIKSYNFILVGIQKIHKPLNYFKRYNLTISCMHELIFRFTETDTNIFDIVTKNIHLGKISLENIDINNKDTIMSKNNILNQCTSYDLLFKTCIIFLIEKLLELDFKKGETGEHFLIEICENDIIFYASILEILYMGKERFTENI